MSQSYNPTSGEQIQLRGPGGTTPTVRFYITAIGIISDFQGTGSPEGVITAEPSSTFRRYDDGSLWIKATGSGNTGWFMVTIPHGTGDPEGVVTAPPGTLYLRTAGLIGQVLYEKVSGTGNTGWSSNGGTIFSPTDSPTNAKFRADKQIGLGKAPTSTYSLDVAGDVNLDALLHMNALTGPRPLQINAAEQVVADKINLESSDQVSGAGLTTNALLFWDATAINDILGVASATVSEITTNTVRSMVEDVVLGGTVPPGLSLSITRQDVSYIEDTDHAVTKGVITT